jgi:hypothetical protein
MLGAKLILALLVMTLAGGVVYADPLFFPLSEHTMAKGVYDYEPMERAYSFSPTDDQAVSWLLIWRDAKSHNVEWRWYYPEGRVYARSFGVLPPIDGYMGFWGAPIWSCLKISGSDPSKRPGNWKVDVLVDFRKVLEEHFTINGLMSC